jgi:hypothetical protein
VWPKIFETVRVRRRKRGEAQESLEMQWKAVGEEILDASNVRRRVLKLVRRSNSMTTGQAVGVLGALRILV